MGTWGGRRSGAGRPKGARDKGPRKRSAAAVPGARQTIQVTDSEKAAVTGFLREMRAAKDAGHPGIQVFIRNTWGDPFKVGQESVKFCAAWGFEIPQEYGWFGAWDGHKATLSRSLYESFQGLLNAAWAYMNATYPASGHKWGIDDNASWGLLPE